MHLSRNIQLHEIVIASASPGAETRSCEKGEAVNKGAPFKNPGNRRQARANALYYAALVETIDLAGAPLQLGQDAFLKAQMWSQMAFTFPEDSDDDYIELMADDQSVAVLDVQTGIQSDLTKIIQERIAVTRSLDEQDRARCTVTLTSDAYDVLKALAVRYVLSSLNRVAIVQRDECDNPPWDLRMVWSPGSPSVQVMIDPTH